MAGRCGLPRGTGRPPMQVYGHAAALKCKRGKASGIVPITDMSGLARNWNDALGVFTTLLYHM